MTAPILRWYQENFVVQSRAAFARGLRRPLVQAPTGAGKTIFFCYIAITAAARCKITWIVVHRRELVKQTVEKLGQFGVTPGVMAAGWKPDYQNRIQVCLIDSMPSRMHLYTVPDLIVPDEAHHVVSEKWSTTLNNIPDARELGVTATPQRLDGRGMGEFFD